MSGGGSGANNRGVICEKSDDASNNRFSRKYEVSIINESSKTLKVGLSYRKCQVEYGVDGKILAGVPILQGEVGGHAKVVIDNSKTCWIRLEALKTWDGIQLVRGTTKIFLTVLVEYAESGKSTFEAPIVDFLCRNVHVKNRIRILSEAVKTARDIDDQIPREISLEIANEDQRKNKSIVLESVRRNGLYLKFAAESLRNDEDVVLAAIKNDGCALEFADPKLKNDKEIVLAALKQNYRAFDFADTTLKKDDEFVLSAVEHHGHALQFADPELRKNKGFVLRAVKRDGRAFQFADTALKNDKEVVIDAIFRDVSSFQFAAEELRKNKEFVLDAIDADYRDLEYADVELKKDKEIVLAAVSQNGKALVYADDELKKDKKFVLAAVSQNGLALAYADAELKKYKGIVLAAVSQDGLALEYADDELKKNKKIVLAAVSQSGRALAYADVELKKDKEIVLAAVSQDGLALEYAVAELKKDKEIVLAAVSQNGSALLFVDDELKKDKDVFLAAVLQNGSMLQYADEIFRKDEDVVLAAVLQNTSALRYADESLRNDKNLVLAARLLDSILEGPDYHVGLDGESHCNDNEFILVEAQSYGAQRREYENEPETRDTGSVRQGHPEKARIERALKVRETTYGFGHSELASSLDDFALLLNPQGHLEQVTALYERALEIREKAYGPNHREMVTMLNNLAILLQAQLTSDIDNVSQGHLEQAKNLYERALRIKERTLGPDVSDVAMSPNDLALLLKDQGHLDAAEPFFERVLNIRENAIGLNSPKVSRTLNNLAVLLYAQGHLERAKPLYERALEIQERSFGPDHPNVAKSLINLAVSLKDQGHLEQAKVLYERALGIMEKAPEPDHSHVALTLKYLASLLQDQGHLEQAKPLYERALGIMEKAPEPDHPHVALTLKYLASLLQDQGHLEQAKPLYERALGIMEKVLGPEHSEVATTLLNLAELLLDQGYMEQAKPLYHRALDIMEKELAPDHPRVASLLNYLAWIFKDQDHLEQAKQLTFGSTLEQAPSPDHPVVATKSLTTHETFAILRENLSLPHVEITLKTAHAVFVCAQSETELPPQIRDELDLYSKESTVFSPFVGDVYGALEGKELAFVVGGFDDEYPTIRRPHGFGYSSAEIVQDILERLPPHRSPKCIVLNFDLSAETLDQSELNGGLDVIAWRGNILDVTKFTAFTKHFVKSYDEYPEGERRLTRAEYAYVNALRKMPWPSNSAEYHVVLLPERERVRDRLEKLKPHELAIPIVSLDASSLETLKQIFPEEKMRIQFTITFHGSARELRNLIKSGIHALLNGVTLGSTILICTTTGAEGRTLLKRLKRPLRKRRRGILSQEEDDESAVSNSLRDLGVLYCASQFLLVETEALETVLKDPQKLGHAKEICDNSKRLLPLKDILSRGKIESTSETSLVYNLMNSYALDASKDADDCRVTVINSSDMQIHVEIAYRQVSSTKMFKHGMKAGHTYANGYMDNEIRDDTGNNDILDAIEFLKPETDCDFPVFGKVFTVKIFIHSSDATWGQVLQWPITATRHQVVYVDHQMMDRPLFITTKVLIPRGGTSHYSWQTIVFYVVFVLLALHGLYALVASS